MKFLQALLADDGHAYKATQYPPLPPPSTRDLTHLLAESPTLLLLFYDFYLLGKQRSLLSGDENDKRLPPK